MSATTDTTFTTADTTFITADVTLAQQSLPVTSTNLLIRRLSKELEDEGFTSVDTSNANSLWRRLSKALVRSTGFVP